MLFKAILTGGVLSVLAGLSVYLGTEGADALERETREDARLESTELAGAAVSEAETGESKLAETVVKTPKKKKKKKRKSGEEQAQSEVVSEAVTEFETVAETVVVQTTPSEWPRENSPEEFDTGADVLAQTSAVQTPPAESAQEKPKTRWLDQYLKSDKKKATSTEPKALDVDVVVEKTGEEEGEVKDAEMTEVEEAVDVETGKKMMAEKESGADAQDSKSGGKKLIVKMDDDKKMVWSSDDGVFVDEEIDMEMVEKLLSEHADLDLNDVKGAKTKIRVIKLGDKESKGQGHRNKMKLKAIDYDAVLVEAKKLQVVDMRNEAFLEIVDYAIDRGDIGNAADIVDELSSPELRDTARQRIGVGLAMNGDMDAAFAVLDEIEIDQLAAPIRLEIITALMATRAERAAQHPAR